MLETYEKNSKKKLLATVLAIVVIAGAIVFADHIKTKGSTSASNIAQTSNTTSAPTQSTATSQTADSSTTTTNSTTPTSSSSTSSSNYNDGTYTATSDYYVPHGSESIQVSLTVSNGVITDASIQNSESDHDSARYQEDFASAYKSYVVGKKISGLQLGIVAGASDTTQGFNDALSQISTKAQA